MLINDCAICVRAIDYSETSQVVTFFARQAGKVTLMAKGAKRTRSPFGGPIEIFSCGKMVYSDSGRAQMGTLAEFEQLAEMPGSSAFAGDMFTLNCCLFAVELVNLLTTDFDPHPGLFDALLTFLHQVSRGKSSESDKKNALAPLVLFQLILLREIGLCPVFEFCVNCKNHFNTQSQQVYFSNNARGLICKDCQGAFPDGVPIAKKAVNCLANVDSVSSADQRTVEEIEGILISYFTDTLGRTPKMAKYVTRR
ncbi:MAG: DNA repair protein RecO [Sedimentisphaerales bacterium]